MEHQIRFKAIVGTGNPFTQLPERGVERLNLDEIKMEHRPKVPVTHNFGQQIIGSAEIKREEDKLVADIILTDAPENLAILQTIRTSKLFGTLKLDNAEVDGNGNISGIINSVGLCATNVDETIPAITLDEIRCPIDRAILINVGPLKEMEDDKDNYCCPTCHRMWVDVHSDEWFSRVKRAKFKKEPEIGDNYTDIIELI